MSKSKVNSSIFENKAFDKAPSVGGFNLVPQVNNFNSIFDIKPLDASESNRIELLLVENYLPGIMPEESVEKDLHSLKAITSEIRSIGRQGTILMGERVYKAREILKNYREGTFLKWIDSTFGTRRTGYNVLSYFELHRDLPDLELKEKFKKLSLKSAYLLANRKGGLEIKANIVQEYKECGYKEFSKIIQEKLPTSEKDKRAKRNSIDRLVTLMQNSVKELSKKKNNLKDSHKKSLNEIKHFIAHLLS